MEKQNSTESESEYEMEEQKMDNSSLNATEIAVGSLLAGGRGGYGYGGAWGGGMPGYGPWASPSANAVRLDRNDDNVNHQGNCTRELLSYQNLANLNAFENAERLNQFTDIRDGQFRGELRVSDLISRNQMDALRNAADIRQQISDCCCDSKVLNLESQLKNQECCCETQKLVFAENQKTRDLISENALRIAVDANNVSSTVNAINAASAQNTAAIIAAIQSLGHHNHH